MATSFGGVDRFENPPQPRAVGQLAVVQSQLGSGNRNPTAADRSVGAIGCKPRDRQAPEPPSPAIRAGPREFYESLQFRARGVSSGIRLRSVELITP